MNKKNNPKYQRKDLMIPIDVIAVYDKKAKEKKKSVKSIMEEILIEQSGVIIAPNDERSVATVAESGKTKLSTKNSLFL